MRSRTHGVAVVGGHILDDEGSGYWIGRVGLSAVLRHRDGRDRYTALTEQALEHFDVNNVNTLSASVQSDPAKDRIAAFSPRVAAAAAQGDIVARDILKEGGRALGRMVIVAAEHLKLSPPFPVACVGGTFRANPHLLAAFGSAIEPHQPNATIVKPPLPPFGGALWLAARLGGLDGIIDPEWLAVMAHGVA